MLDNPIQHIASDEVFDEAYTWLCKRREKYSHNDEVWRVPFHWEEIKPHLQQQLVKGDYSFSPLRRYRLPDNCLEIWNALDSLVLKAIAIVLVPCSRGVKKVSVVPSRGMLTPVTRVSIFSREHAFHESVAFTPQGVTHGTRPLVYSL